MFWPLVDVVTYWSRVVTQHECLQGSREGWESPVATPETPENFVRGGSDPPHGPAVMALLPLGRRHNNTENHSRIRLAVQRRAKNADDLQIKDGNYTNSTRVLYKLQSLGAWKLKPGSID